MIENIQGARALTLDVDLALLLRLGEPRRVLRWSRTKLPLNFAPHVHPCCSHFCAHAKGRTWGWKGHCCRAELNFGAGPSHLCEAGVGRQNR